MNKQDAIQHFGSSTKLAQALGISKQAVSQWEDELPIGRQYQIEVVTEGKLKAGEEPERAA